MLLHSEPFLTLTGNFYVLRATGLWLLHCRQAIPIGRGLGRTACESRIDIIDLITPDLTWSCFSSTLRPTNCCRSRPRRVVSVSTSETEPSVSPSSSTGSHSVSNTPRPGSWHSVEPTPTRSVTMSPTSSASPVSARLSALLEVLGTRAAP